MDIQPGADALIIVDMQNDFANPDGSTYVGGAIQILEPINKLIEAFESAKATIIYSQDWHPKESLHFKSQDSTWPEHCIQDSWGSELHEQLRVVDDAVMIKKGTERELEGYSAFRNKNVETGDNELTGLSELLNERDIERVFICGVATDYCIKHTAIDSAKSGFDTYVVENAIKAAKKDPADESLALQEMEGNGAALVTLE